MAGKARKFGSRQEEAIVALLTQPNIEEAARAAKIGTRTLVRWLSTPEFKQAFFKARREAFGQAIARLQQGASAAASALLKTLVDPATPASVRVRAAEVIFNHSAKSFELEDIEGRLSALERTAEETTGTKR